MSELLNIQNLGVCAGDLLLCSGVSFDVLAGDCIMLCGANGSGKTSLLRRLTQMSACDGGEVVMVPTRIPKVRGFSLREFVGLSCRNPLPGRVDAAIDRMGLSDLSDRDISRLSDGQFQRAVLASALVRDASVLLLDEPTAFLDIPGRQSLLQVMRSVCNGDAQGRGRAMIFSTHDIHDGLRVATKVISIGSDGVFRQTPPSEDPVPYLF